MACEEREDKMKKIIIYSSSSCTNCTAAKEYIKEKGYDYEEKNVSIDKQAKKELIDLGYMGVPVIMIDDQVVVGFNKNKLDEIL
jgi:glutaredoxin-like YruB-family protein